MLLDCDYKVKGKVKRDLITLLKNKITSTNWNKEEFDRHDKYLAKTGGWQGITFPYILTEKHKPPFTQEQQEIFNLCLPIIAETMKVYPGYEVVRGELSILVPGLNLEQHRDGSWFHRECSRVHIPIYTNPNCKQTFEEREYHFEPGTIYEMNNRIVHASYNRGKEPRIHIILDIGPKLVAEFVKNNIGTAVSLVPKPVDGAEVK